MIDALQDGGVFWKANELKGGAEQARRGTDRGTTEMKHWKLLDVLKGETNSLTLAQLWFKGSRSEFVLPPRATGGSFPKVPNDATQTEDVTNGSSLIKLLWWGVSDDHTEMKTWSGVWMRENRRTRLFAERLNQIYTLNGSISLWSKRQLNSILQNSFFVSFCNVNDFS